MRFLCALRPLHIHRLVFLSVIVPVSFGLMESSNAAGLQDSLLKQQVIKTEHRKKYPYSRYLRLTLRRDENNQPNGVFVYPGEDPVLFQKAGFKEGDVITEVDGMAATTNASAVTAVEKLYGGSFLEILVENKGVSRQILISFEELYLQSNLHEEND